VSESSKTVAVAITVNAAIALSKYVAGFASGSAAMIAEAIHSTVDTGNEALLFLGLKRSQRPPDEVHPFGHGQELYFWSLVVAIVIFGLGGGAAIIEGVWRFTQPREISNVLWNYVVLAIALAFEMVSWIVAYRALGSERPGLPLLRAVRSSKDPSRFVVLLEDSAAIAGVLIALIIGTFLASLFPRAHFDAIASILIGLLLAAAAVFLIAETRGLLIGEAADKETVEGIRAMLHANPDVLGINRILTMQLAPESVLLNLDLEFKKEIAGSELPAIVQSIDRSIRARYPEIAEVFVRL
jgi:cation diffusion facilitator family transporter